MSGQIKTSLNSVSELWAQWMLPMAWQVAVLVVVLLAISWLLHRRSARLRYALWMLVPVRLVIPPTLAVVTGWGWWLLPPSTDVATTQPLSFTRPEVVGVAENSMPRIDTKRSDDLNAEEIIADHHASGISRENMVEASTQVPFNKARTAPITWQSYAFCVWLLGIGLMSFRFLLGITQAREIIRSDLGGSSENETLKNVFEACCQTVGIRRRVYLCESISTASPMLIGFYRPTIVLPKGIVERLSVKELEAVMIHELNHIVRRDAPVSVFQSLFGIVYFFNPFVWIANLAINRLREYACDEATLASVAGDRKNYGSGLVKVAEMMTEPAPKLALGIAESSGQVNRRLQRILDPACPIGSRLSWTSIVFVLLAGVVLLPSAAEQVAQSPGPTKVGQTTATKSNDSHENEPESNQTSIDTGEDKAPQATIRGVVIDSAGRPMDGALIRTESVLSERGPVLGSTDAKGVFELTAYVSQLRGASVVAMANDEKLMGSATLPWTQEEFASVPYQIKLQPSRRVIVDVVDGEGMPVADATVYILHSLPTKKTSAEGRTEFLLPADLQVQFIFAMKAGVGADYIAYVVPDNVRGDQKAKAPELPKTPVKMTLDRVNPIRVRIVDAKDRPIFGVGVYPWILTKPGQSSDLNLSFLRKYVKQETNADGEVLFRWIPSWNKNVITFWPNANGYTRERGNYDPKTDDGSLTIKLQQLEPIRGRVTMPDGSPSKGVRVVANGDGFNIDSFSKEVTTKEDGGYEVFVAPNMVYLVTAQTDKLASSPQTGFAVLPGAPIDNLDFQLRPATRLFGKVTVGDDKKPVEGQRILVSQFGNDPRLQLPNRYGGRRSSVRPRFSRTTSTDADGNFELLVGSGKFDIRGPKQMEKIAFEITDELQREFNFHAERPDRGILKGSVINSETNKPIADAIVTGIYRKIGAYPTLGAKTDGDGNFEVQRERYTTVVHATNLAKTLSGVVEIGPDDEAVTIPIAPLASATGVLLDDFSKFPIVGQEILYSVNVAVSDRDQGPFRPSFGGETTTDESGRFKIKSLIIGQEYQISATIHGRNQNVHWKPIGSVTPKSAADVDLGELKLERNN